LHEALGLDVGKGVGLRRRRGQRRQDGEDRPGKGPTDGFRPFSKLAGLPFVTPSMLLGIEPAIDECVKRRRLRAEAIVSQSRRCRGLLGWFGWKMTHDNDAGDAAQSPETVVTHAGRHPFEDRGYVNTPVYRGSTILFSDARCARKQRAALRLWPDRQSVLSGC